MTDERSELEQHLVREPFDAAARLRYASALLVAAAHEAGLVQFRLLLKQAPSAAAHVGAAVCCLRLGDVEGSRQHAASARDLPDFDPSDPRLAELEPALAASAPARLQVLVGGKREAPSQVADVISIGRGAQVRFSDIVGMHELKKVIRLRIIEPFAKPGLFQRFKKASGGGVLLYGPPGCGKTLMARAIASECEANFTAVGISDVLNMWVGASERNLAAIFDKARSEAPSVLFFDEMDALAFARTKASSDHTRTLVNEFLAQLDGMSGRNERVLILAATNMPWDVDEAMRRPGRFDRQVFVPPPDASARAEMLRVKLRDVPHDPFDADAIAQRCKHFSGADIDGVIEHAKDVVLGEILDGAEERSLRKEDLMRGVELASASTLEWLKTARNLVKYGGGGAAYKDVERYLREEQLY